MRPPRCGLIYQVAPAVPHRQRGDLDAARSPIPVSLVSTLGVGRTRRATETTLAVQGVIDLPACFRSRRNDMLCYC